MHPLETNMALGFVHALSYPRTCPHRHLKAVKRLQQPLTIIDVQRQIDTTEEHKWGTLINLQFSTCPRCSYA